MNQLLSTVSLYDAAAVLAGVVLVVGVLRRVWPVLAKLKDLIDDLVGEPARKGVAARPGLMERMANVEEKVTSAEYHSRPNGGASAYDALMREVQGLGSRLEYMDAKIDGHITMSEAERAALRADVDIVLLKKATPEE